VREVVVVVITGETVKVLRTVEVSGRVLELGE
jgi:hypothetical protein